MSRAGFVAFLCIISLMWMLPDAVEAKPKTKVKFKREFRQETYSFTDVDTVVVFAARVSPPKPRRLGDGWSWQSKIELPPDSICLELAREIGKSITRRDSSVSVIVLLNRDSAATDSSLTVFAHDSIGADAVFLAEAIESRTEASSSGIPVLFERSIFSNIGAHQAQATAKIRFSLQDAMTGALVWSVTCETKHKTGGGGALDFNGEPAPPLESAVAAAYTAAMSKLPF